MSLEIGFRILIVSGNSDSFSYIPDSEAQHSGFQSPGFWILKPRIPDSGSQSPGFWIPKPRILDSEAQDSGFQSPGFWISKTRILDSKAQDSGFQSPGFWIPKPWILDSKAQDSGFHKQFFTDSGIRTPLHEATNFFSFDPFSLSRNRMTILWWLIAQSGNLSWLQ